jgi:hypothetical protein
MSFRWVALIALWTLFSGPMFAPPSRPGKPVAAEKQTATKNVHAQRTR